MASTGCPDRGTLKAFALGTLGGAPDAEAAQPVAERLIDAGVLGILNFAPVRLDVHDRVAVVDIDLSLTLEQLAFQASLGLTGSLDED